MVQHAEQRTSGRVSEWLVSTRTARTLTLTLQRHVFYGAVESKMQTYPANVVSRKNTEPEELSLFSLDNNLKSAKDVPQPRSSLSATTFQPLPTPLTVQTLYPSLSPTYASIPSRHPCRHAIPGDKSERLPSKKLWYQWTPTWPSLQNTVVHYFEV